MAPDISALANPIWVGCSDQLAEGEYLKIDALFVGKPTSVVVFRHRGACMAYRNLCVHMPRALDCERDMIFDASGEKLQCTMHGIVYDPATGASESILCKGQRLTRVKVEENGEGIWIVDSRFRLP